MSTRFQINDPSIESQWRSLILFGKNSATYKFAFAKSLINLIANQTTNISLADLAVPFARHIIEHLKANDKQGSSQSIRVLKYLKRDFWNVFLTVMNFIMKVSILSPKPSSARQDKHERKGSFF